jgi:hypothetical protein
LEFVANEDSKDNQIPPLDSTSVFKSNSEIQSEKSASFLSKTNDVDTCSTERQNFEAEKVCKPIKYKADKPKKPSKELLEQFKTPNLIVSTRASLVEDETYFSDHYDEEKSKVRKSLLFEQALDPDDTINSQTMVTFTENSMMNNLAQNVESTLSIQQTKPPIPVPIQAIKPIEIASFENNKNIKLNSLMIKKKSMKCSSSSNLTSTCKEDGFSINNGT